MPGLPPTITDPHFHVRGRGARGGDGAPGPRSKRRGLVLDALPRGGAPASSRATPSQIWDVGRSPNPNLGGITAEFPAWTVGDYRKQAGALNVRGLVHVEAIVGQKEGASRDRAGRNRCVQTVAVAQAASKRRTGGECEEHREYPAVFTTPALAGGFVLDPVAETRAVVAQAPQLGAGQRLVIVPYVHLGRDDAEAVSGGLVAIRGPNGGDRCL